MRWLVLFIVALCVGCTPYISGALMMHSERYDAPEVTMKNPVAEVEVGGEYNNYAIFIRHSSGLFDTEQGYGFNAAGVRYTWK